MHQVGYLKNCKRPTAPQNENRELGIFEYGWQHAASTQVESHFQNELRTQFSEAERAFIMSQSGPNAGAHFIAIPSEPHLRINPAAFRVLLLRRLRQPLPLITRRCRCHHLLDSLGDHRAACAVSGVLAIRGYPLEVAAGRMCREAGARVQMNQFVRNLNIDNPRPDDGRRIEVIANGLRLYHGAQLAIDTTRASALKRDGTARAQAATKNGIALHVGRKRKEATYPELIGRNGRARLIVIGLEVGGRWSNEAVHFVRQLAIAKSQDVVPRLQLSSKLAWQRRWSMMRSVAAQRAIAESSFECPKIQAFNGDVPSVHAVLSDDKYQSVSGIAIPAEANVQRALPVVGVDGNLRSSPLGGSRCR